MKGGVKQLRTTIKAAFLGMCLTIFFAGAAFAQSTPAQVQSEVVSEATPYFTQLIGIVIALFGLALLVVLARKAAGMARGAIKKG
jgi:hypothetical protein